VAKDVFISYKNEDRQAAESICAGLERQNITCWMAPRDIIAGEEWATAIVEGLRNSRTFVLLLSSHSRNARQIAREAELADRQKLPMITLRLEDVEPPPELLYFVGNIQWLDAFGGQFDSAVKKLAEFARRYEVGKRPQANELRSAATATAPASPPAVASDQAVSEEIRLGSSNAAGGKAHRNAQFDSEVLERVSRDLAPYLGPMAKVIVKRAAGKADSWKQLYDALAAEIPDGPERKKFLAKRPL
jgi:hypothetical protein